MKINLTAEQAKAVLNALYYAAGTFAVSAKEVQSTPGLSKKFEEEVKTLREVIRVIEEQKII